MKNKVVIAAITLALVLLSGPVYAYKVWTLAYTGDGTDNRNITVSGMNAGSGASLFIRVINNVAQYGAMRFSTQVGDKSLLHATASGEAANYIQSAFVTGFQVGNSARVNGSGSYYMALILEDDGSGDMATGDYVGNGAERDISIALSGVSPDYVFVKGIGAQLGYAAYSSLGDTANLAKTDGDFAFSADRIISLKPNVFRIGTNANINASGVSFYFVTVVQNPKCLLVGTYTGNETGASVVTTNLTGSNVTGWVEVSGNTTFSTHVNSYHTSGNSTYSYSTENALVNVITAVGNGAQTFTLGGVGADTNYRRSNGKNTVYAYLSAQDGDTATGAATTVPKRRSRVIVTVTDAWRCLRDLLAPRAWAIRAVDGYLDFRI